MTVDEYIAKVDREEARTRLKRMREIVREEAPEADEGISYGIPGYKLNGVLVHIATFKNHCSLFGPGNMEQFAEQLEGYKMSKGTVQFPHSEPLPEDLIRSIVRARVKENRAKPAKKSK
jgi:uncharacterized protein YdhG (YjbR/CyaY superfamily)